nr:DUF1573 domain-containing protein [Crateriforma conspicua]
MMDIQSEFLSNSFRGLVIVAIGAACLPTRQCNGDDTNEIAAPSIEVDLGTFVLGRQEDLLKTIDFKNPIGHKCKVVEIAASCRCVFARIENKSLGANDSTAIQVGFRASTTNPTTPRGAHSKVIRVSLLPIPPIPGKRVVQTSIRISYTISHPLVAVPPTVVAEDVIAGQSISKRVSIHEYESIPGSELRIDSVESTLPFLEAAIDGNEIIVRGKVPRFLRFRGEKLIVASVSKQGKKMPDVYIPVRMKMKRPAIVAVPGDIVVFEKPKEYPVVKLVKLFGDDLSTSTLVKIRLLRKRDEFGDSGEIRFSRIAAQSSSKTYAIYIPRVREKEAIFELLFEGLDAPVHLRLLQVFDD